MWSVTAGGVTDHMGHCTQEGHAICGPPNKHLSDQLADWNDGAPHNLLPVALRDLFMVCMVHFQFWVLYKWQWRMRGSPVWKCRFKTVCYWPAVGWLNIWFRLVDQCYIPNSREWNLISVCNVCTVQLNSETTLGLFLPTCQLPGPSSHINTVTGLSTQIKPNCHIRSREAYMKRVSGGGKMGRATDAMQKK